MKTYPLSLGRCVLAGLIITLGASAAPADLFHGSDDPLRGFTSLFNGRDLAGWTVPAGDNGHWKVLNGAIDYDAQSEAKGSKNLISAKSYRDFVLKLDWRIKETTGQYQVPVVLPDGTHKLDAAGKEIKVPLPNADSGIYVRGSSKAQINIWCWPIGSGEVYGYRMDKKMPPEVRAGVTPVVKADRPVGEWNTFEIVMRGDRLTVVLNGRVVIANAQLPGVPEQGPLELQHHGGRDPKTGAMNAASSLVQFRNIHIREL
jgi:hypothetical protein